MNTVPKVGDKVPVFRLKDGEGNLFDLKDMIGRKQIVLFFYPKNFTPGCTKEVCMFRDAHEEFQDLGAEVIGISSDSERSHRNFTSSHELPFTLLSDPDAKVRRLYGVKGYLWNLLPGRETFVIDKTGTICMVFNNLKAPAHIRKALQTLKKSACNSIH